MLLTLAFRNIWRNKRRSIITLASICFAVFFSAILQSTQLGSYENMITNVVGYYTGYIQIHKNGYWDEKNIDNTFDYNPEMVYEIASPEVTLIIPRLESFALASFKTQTKGALIVGIIPEEEDQLTRLKSKIVKGDYLTFTSDGVLISEGLSEYLRMGVSDTLVLIGQGYHGSNAVGKYAVTGVLKFPTPDLNSQSVFMTLNAAQTFYAAENMISALVIGIEDPKQVEAITESVSKSLDLDALEVMNWMKLMPGLEQSIELDYRSGLILLFVLYAIVGFGMFGTFLMMTRERRYEFGILIAIGLTRIKLQSIMFVEIAVMAFLGVIGGVILSLPVIIYFHFNPIKFSGDFAQAFERFGIEPIIPFSLDPILFYNQAWVVLIMTLFLGVYPMFVIRKLKVVEAMRD